MGSLFKDVNTVKTTMTINDTNISGTDSIPVRRTSSDTKISYFTLINQIIYSILLLSH
jgi:hypothetical protein